jgi:hypothetical protein|tara:strand:+ start:200 stop:568 length:369 start_codon:yes stop_codon:yes gene_type:complete
MDNNVQRAAMSNVIQFPVKNYKPHVPQTEKELKAHAEAIRLKFIQQHAVDFAFDCFRSLETHGFDLRSDPEIKYDLVLISEAIKSAMCRSLEQKHPLQEFAQNIINLKEADIDFADFDEEEN